MTKKQQAAEDEKKRAYIESTMWKLLCRAPRIDPQDAIRLVNLYAGIAHRSYLHHMGKLTEEEQVQLGNDWALFCTSGDLTEFGLVVPNTAHLRARKKATE